MMNSLELTLHKTHHLFRFFINNLFSLYVLWGGLNMLGFKSYEGGMMKASTVIALISLPHVKWELIDLIVVFYIFYSILTGLWGDVSGTLYYDGIVTQLMPISMYFIARSEMYSDNKFLDNMKWPLLFAFVCALLLYFLMPSWYIDFKTNSWTHELSGTSYYEHMRLSGFWPWSYFLGYASLFYIMYELNRYAILQTPSPHLPILLIPAFLVIFLAQQRVSIAYCFLFILFLIIYTRRHKLNSFTPLIKWCIITIIIGGIIVTCFLSVYDASLFEYILDRSVNSDSNIVSDRFDLFEKFTRTISFLGLGLGHNSHLSRVFGSNEITDCDYLRILNEIGVLGFAILFFIISITLLRGLKHINSCFFEINVVLFLLAAMIGAAPLEHLPLHPYIYWFCIGNIINKSFIDDNVETSNSNTCI